MACTPSYEITWLRGWFVKRGGETKSSKAGSTVRSDAVNRTVSTVPKMIDKVVLGLLVEPARRLGQPP